MEYLAKMIDKQTRQKRTKGHELETSVGFVSFKRFRITDRKSQSPVVQLEGSEMS